MKMTQYGKKNSKQGGVFIIELALVLTFIAALVIFTGDIAFQLFNRVSLDRASFSLVNVVKERTRFFQANPNVTREQVEDLNTLAAGLIHSDSPHGIRVEWTVDGHNVTSINVPMEGGQECVSDDSLQNQLDLVPEKTTYLADGTNRTSKVPTYQVTLCMTSISRFSLFSGGDDKPYLHSSSIMPGR